jgi:large subunit ribosomal protein L30
MENTQNSGKQAEQAKPAKPKEAKPVKPSVPEKQETNGLLAVVLVRGMIRVRQPIKDTLAMLNLKTKNSVSLIPNTPTMFGMIKKVKDYVTWGSIDLETLTILKKRGEHKNYRLNPPRKGYGRKGIKKSFHIGGALGNRGEKINDLLQRMI